MLRFDLLVILFIFLAFASCKKDKIPSNIEENCIHDTIISNLTINPIDYYLNIISNQVYYDTLGNSVIFEITRFHPNPYITTNTNSYADNGQCYVEHFIDEKTDYDISCDTSQFGLSYSFTSSIISGENINILNIGLLTTFKPDLGGYILLPDTTGSYNFNKIKNSTEYLFLDSLLINSNTFYDVYYFKHETVNGYDELFFNFEHGTIKFKAYNKNYFKS